jgi:hypothetical protein
MGAELLRTDGRTWWSYRDRQTDRQAGTTKLLIAFRKFAKALKKPNELMMTIISQTVNYKHQRDISEDPTGLNPSPVNKLTSCYGTWLFLTYFIRPRHCALSRATGRKSTATNPIYLQCSCSQMPLQPIADLRLLNGLLRVSHFFIILFYIILQLSN